MKLESLLVDHDESVRWSVDVRDAVTGRRVFALNAEDVLRTASIAKLHLLAEVASLFSRGELDQLLPLDRRSVSAVADSGIWQHLTVDVLPTIDVVRLVGIVSDNLATNVLLDHVGLSAVQHRARQLAPHGSTLHDFVRDQRAPADPPTLSSGTAADWASFFVLLHEHASEGAVESMILDWLAHSADLSMVASAFGLDPLAHGAAPDRGFSVWNKTGTDVGVRADVGLVMAGDRAVAYAVLCNWDPAALSDPRDEVLHTMRDIGEAIRVHLIRANQGAT